MIDIAQLRREPDVVKAALARRGVANEVLDSIIALDVAHRQRLQEAEKLRADVKELSRQVGEARRAKDNETAEALTAQSRELGEAERAASEVAEELAATLRSELLMICLLYTSPSPRD